jgi:hypothetical protein
LISESKTSCQRPKTNHGRAVLVAGLHEATHCSGYL